MSKKKKIPSVTEEVTPKKETVTMPTYTSRWEEELSEILAEIENSQPFSYDPAGDPAYLRLKSDYQKSGNLAMQDTVGAASALTGGYANSYAMTAGQAAYNAALSGLSGALADLQQSAYDRYKDDRSALENRFAMLSELQSADYKAYRDSVSDYYAERELAYKENRDAIEDSRYESETAYKKEQDAIKNDRLDREFLEDQSRYDYENGIIAPTDFENFTASDFERYFRGIALLEDKSAAITLIEELARLNVISKGSIDYYRTLVENAY